MTDFLPYNYLVFCLFFLAAFSLGSRALSRTGFAAAVPETRLVLSFALGLGIYSNAVFLLCALQWLYAPVCLVLLLAPPVLGRGELRALGGWIRSVPWREGWSKTPAILKLGGAAFFFNFLLVCAGASTPPTVSDATNVHALIPKLYIRHHGFAFLPNIQASNYPCLHVELLYAFCMRLSSDILAQMMSIYYLGVMLGGIYLLGRTYRSPGLACGAVLFFFFNMDVMVQASMAWVDLAWNSYALLAFFLIHRWHSSLKEGREDRASLYLAGIFCGFAAQTKIFAPVIVLIFFLILIFLLIRDHRPPGFILRRAFSFAALALLLEAPYYLKNVWAFGNPLWPFFQEYFGNKNNALAYTAGMFQGPLWRNTGTGLRDFLLFPWNLLTRPQLFHSSPLNPFYLALLPFFLLVKTPKPAFSGMISPFFLLFLPFWFLETPETRFMLAFLAILSILYTSLLVETSGRDRGIQKILIFLSCIWIGTVSFGNVLIQWKSLPFVLGLMDRDQYIRSRVNGRFSHSLEWYDAFSFINGNLDQDAGILFPDTHFYYCDRTIVDLVEAGVWNRQGNIADEAGLLERLKAGGVTHILTKQRAIGRDREKYEKFNAFLDHLKKRKAIRETYSKDGITLYAFVS